ncbi:cell division protein FtsL [Natronobacillus azotifigens]|uniref:Cell division protein FtsL n=1 Tax=Natronobacillus azotifigens TaxID=472978 RepID=A0A9J6RGS3_9BACI|nr:cell division protein FtsL [Natronobacillus azotifigens]MCZ0704531.1 cell division protein FtsL [Natronobacillus azotifigens]
MTNSSEARQWQQTIPERTRRTEPRQRPQKQTKVKSRRITTGEKLLGVMYGVLTAIALLYIVSFSSNIDSINRDVQRLENQISEQETINANLEYQVIEYSNPDRILAVAKENGLEIQNTRVRQTTKYFE